MITNLLPVEATHSTFHFFEKQPQLITFDNAYIQTKWSIILTRLSSAWVWVLVERNNFIDLHKLVLEINAKIPETTVVIWRQALTLQVPIKYVSTIMHWILCFQNAPYPQLVLNYQTLTEILRTRLSMSLNCFKEKQQKKRS